MAEQVHLERGLLDVHRLHAELLGLHHDRAAPSSRSRAVASVVARLRPRLLGTRPPRAWRRCGGRPGVRAAGASAPRPCRARDRARSRTPVAAAVPFTRCWRTCTRISHVCESSARRVGWCVVVDVDPAHVACELVDALDLLDRERSQRVRRRRRACRPRRCPSAPPRSFAAIVDWPASIGSGPGPLSRPRRTRDRGREHVACPAVAQHTCRGRQRARRS